MKHYTVGIHRPEDYGLIKLKHGVYGMEPVALATSFDILID